MLLALALAAPSLDDVYLYHFYTVPLQESDPTTADVIEQADIFLTDLIHRHAQDGYPILITWDDFTRANITYLNTRDYPQRRSGIAADGTLNVPAWDGKALVMVPANPNRLRHDGWIPEHDGRSFAMLADGQQMMLPPLKLDAAARLQQQIDAGQPVDTVTDWLGQPVGALYLLDLTPDDFDLSMTPVNASLEGQVELVGYRVDSPSLIPGQPLWITLYWRAQSGAKQDYESFVQLWDTNEQPVAKVHRWTLDGVYRTRLWQPGELVPVRFMVNVPDGLPVGEYSLAVGLFRVLENTPLQALDSGGKRIRRTDHPCAVQGAAAAGDGQRAAATRTDHLRWDDCAGRCQHASRDR